MKSTGPVILIVEDEGLIALDLANQVQALGYSVLGPVSSVEAAAEILDHHDPQAALLDADLNGVPVTPIALRLNQSRIPYALVTGWPSVPDSKLATAPRLPKPFSRAELAQMLRQLLQK